MKQKRDYYQLLHVQPDAPSEVIKASYRTIMQRMRMHPDLGGDCESAAAINEAYAVLTEPDHRAAYDKQYSDREPEPEIAGQPAYPDVSTEPRCPFCYTLKNSGRRSYGKAGSGSKTCVSCSSPLSFANPVSGDENGRRAISRVPQDRLLTFYTHWPQRKPFIGRTGDISLTGMHFYSKQPLDVGQIIKLDMKVLQTVAQVARVERGAGRWDVGIRFLTLRFEQARGTFIADSV